MGNVLDIKFSRSTQAKTTRARSMANRGNVKAKTGVYEKKEMA